MFQRLNFKDIVEPFVCISITERICSFRHATYPANYQSSYVISLSLFLSVCLSLHKFSLRGTPLDSVELKKRVTFSFSVLFIGNLTQKDVAFS